MSLGHPAARRSFVQTGGFLVQDIHRDLRDEFDQVDHVAWIGGGCFKLYDQADKQIGIIQFQADVQSRVDDAVAATTLRLAEGAAKPANTRMGDTVIRSLDMSNPDDAALMRQARENGGAIFTTPDRVELPPIDMPDYDGDGAAIDADPIAASDDQAAKMRIAIRFVIIALVLAAVTIACVIAGGYLNA